MWIATFVSTATTYAQHTDRLHVTRKIRDSISRELAIAIADDQRYRWMCQFGTLDQREVDSFKSLDDASKFKRMAQAGGNKVGISKYQKDSLGILQDKLDSLNFVKVMGIIYKYGYPRNENDRNRLSVIVMHNDSRIDTAFLSTVKQEVFSGRLPAIDYAIWYDRFRSVRHLPKLYYIADEYNEAHNSFAQEKPKNVEETNEAREEIGLKKLGK